MKKISLMLGVLAFMLPVVASAASFTISPASGSYHVGDTVTLRISADPAGSTIYTAMLDARFSPSQFEISSFTLGDALLPLKSNGYDALDNSAGVLTKTGGYTGGISSAALFATIVLRAKASGTASFTVADSSKLLDDNNADQQSGAQTYSYTVVAASAPTPVATTLKTTTAQATKVQTQAVKTKTPASSTASTSADQLAAVSQSGASAPWLWIFGAIVLLVVFGLGYFTGSRKLI